MNLQKFGVKFFLKNKDIFSSKNYIPLFHKWIQDSAISDHLLIDVADYSHVLDGPGVMLIAHQGVFSLDQENNTPGLMYMRKVNIDGDFTKRFNKVLSTTIDAANRLKNNDVTNNIDFISNSFRFIANDRLYAKNSIVNQQNYEI